MDVLTLAALMAAGVKIVSVIKQVWPQIPSWGIQILAWTVTIVLIFLGSEMQVIRDTVINDVPLSLMDFWTKFGYGFILGSVGSLVTNDVLAAIDKNRTTSV